MRWPCSCGGGPSTTISGVGGPRSSPSSGRRRRPTSTLLTDVLTRTCSTGGQVTRDFFIRKAVGWALRQHARVEPDWVRAYVDRNRERLVAAVRARGDETPLTGSSPYGVAMRIASLVPSTTEIVAALGLADALVARTHECDHPASVLHAAAVTADLLPPGLTPAEIDVAVARSVTDHHTIYALDAEALQATEPDVVLTQSTCAVCAVDRATVDAACSMGSGGRRLVRPGDARRDPRRHRDDRQGARGAGRGRAAGRRPAPAPRRGRAPGLGDRDRPRVAVVEWPDPVYAPGHWVPDLVEAAGGTSRCSASAAARSVRTGDRRVGRDPARTSSSSRSAATTSRPPRASSRACGTGADWQPVYALGVPVVCADGSAHFSRPGPRVVDGVEHLATMLSSLRSMALIGASRPAA